MTYEVLFAGTETGTGGNFEANYLVEQPWHGTLWSRQENFYPGTSDAESTTIHGGTAHTVGRTKGMFKFKDQFFVMWFVLIWQAFLSESRTGGRFEANYLVGQPWHGTSWSRQEKFDPGASDAKSTTIYGWTAHTVGRTKGMFGFKDQFFVMRFVLIWHTFPSESKTSMIRG